MNKVKEKALSIIMWIVGVFFVLLGIGQLGSSNIILGIIMLIIAGLFIPPSSDFLEKKTKRKISAGEPVPKIPKSLRI